MCSAEHQVHVAQGATGFLDQFASQKTVNNLPSGYERKGIKTTPQSQKFD
jgi:hypothetical protein